MHITQFVRRDKYVIIRDDKSKIKEHVYTDTDFEIMSTVLLFNRTVNTTSTCEIYSAISIHVGFFDHL